ncbi:hypothetical protein TRFO_35959 [Tritrichomonas foetus]|uniref:Uncharacterized protein n=1 Tax=Tritrichomonas foetus TaxID=1144522 RepID=A0A1J4JEY0_9EUKA|nr:hypothetical protein TRFO_35959 [Tritrichomonas foetus]|eukprot:OHS97750.1 hypothetical protein TRFO_35959 [Tritrichomonas foetus]
MEPNPRQNKPQKYDHGNHIRLSGRLHSSIFKQLKRRELDEKLDIFRLFLFIVIFIMSIICLLSDPRRRYLTFFDHIFYLALISQYFIKLLILYRNKDNEKSLWQIIWKRYSFHAMLFTTALYIGNLIPLIFVLEIFLFSLRKVSKFVRIKIAPRLGDFSEMVKEKAQSISKSKFIKFVEDVFRFVYLPYLLMLTFAIKSGRVFMAFCVYSVVFAPFMYINNELHQKYWKEINYIVTQFAFDNTSNWMGIIVLKIVEYFQIFTDLLAVLYQ